MQNKTQDDIEISYIFNSIKKILLYIKNSIINLFIFSLKKWIPLLIFILTTTSLFITSYLVSPKYYSSELTISHIRVENDYCMSILNSLDIQVKNSKDKSTLANELGISKEYAKKIKSIKYLPLNTKIATIYADSLSTLLPFKVKVEVFDNLILDTLQINILKYLEYNKYALKRKEIDSISLSNLKTGIENEIKQTDSLKILVNQSIIPRGSGNGIIMGQPIDPVNVYNRKLDLYERGVQVNRKQALNNSFEIVVGFVKQQTPEQNINFYLILGILSGYIIGLFWLRRAKK